MNTRPMALFTENQMGTLEDYKASEESTMNATISEKEQNRINHFLTIADNMTDYETDSAAYKRLFQTARLAYYNLTIEGQEIANNRYFETFGKNWR